MQLHDMVRNMRMRLVYSMKRGMAKSYTNLVFVLTRSIHGLVGVLMASLNLGNWWRLNAPRCDRLYLGKYQAITCGVGGGSAFGYVGCGAKGCEREEGPNQGLGGRARAERTENMETMFVTLEVSKLLRGWSN